MKRQTCVLRIGLAAGAVWALGMTSTVLADVDHLTIGDRAPRIDIAHWVKGEAVTEFEKDKVYVMEFWATWCGPCRAGMPHLSEMQEKHAEDGVTIIGVSDESLQRVVGFLFEADRGDEKVQNDRTHYTLAADPDRSAYNDYMKAAHQNGIPTAFIVGRGGRIEWIGHPISMDEPLAAVVAGTWDREPFKEKFEKRLALKVKLDEGRERLKELEEVEDWPGMLKVLDELLELDEGNSMLTRRKVMLLATKQEDYDRAYELIGKLVEESWDNANVLNSWAWFIVDEKALERRDLDLAMKAADRANELTEEKSAAILDTVARVYYFKGDLAGAIKYQSAAVETAKEGSRMAEELTKRLEEYEEESGKENE